MWNGSIIVYMVKQKMTKKNTIIFITGNSGKFLVAQKALKGSGYSLVQKKLEVPEIQSQKIEEIASFSAKWAAEKLDNTVVVTDVGYYIEALNGFPGPFVKFVNQWLSPEHILKIMSGIENRGVIVKDCLAFCQPGLKPVCFLGISKGTISTKAGRKRGSAMDRLFIPDNFNKPQSEISQKQMFVFWSKNQKWLKLIDYLKNKLK